MKRLVLILLVLISGCTVTSTPDEYAIYNFTYITTIYDINPEYDNLNSNFAQGDAVLIEARIGGSDPTDSLFYYKKALKDTDDPREQAILYETIASISGNKGVYSKSYKIWRELGNEFRANIDLYLMTSDDPPYEFEEYQRREAYVATPKDTTQFSLGESYFLIEEDDVLVSQVDRVTRDWLSSQLQDPSSEELLTVFSEQYDVEDIGWHEGGRVKQYLEFSDFEHEVVTGTIVRKIDGKWYAPNEKGVFMFEVPIDKIQYPTTRFLNENLALVIDTHGVNMLVEQAIEEEATVVMGCCDHPGKIDAALYLNSKGIKVICNTDKHLPEVIGQTSDTLGSVPAYDANDKVRVGYQPILIDVSETIVVLDSVDNYGLTYYNTPTLYFTILQEKTLLPLDLVFVTIEDYGELQELTKKARELDAHVIAARSYNKEDYLMLSEWLEDDINNRLILFHSEPYPYGYKLYREYPYQVTFDDVMPRYYSD